eukprot:154800-Amorphochlora_amoeboformis.AAC.1
MVLCVRTGLVVLLPAIVVITHRDQLFHVPRSLVHHFLQGFREAFQRGFSPRSITRPSGVRSAIACSCRRRGSQC